MMEVFPLVSKESLELMPSFMFAPFYKAVSSIFTAIDKLHKFQKDRNKRDIDQINEVSNFFY